MASSEEPLYTIPQGLLNILQGLSLTDQEPRPQSSQPRSPPKPAAVPAWAGNDSRVRHEPASPPQTLRSDYGQRVRHDYAETPVFRPGAIFPLIKDRFSFTVHSNDGQTRQEVAANPRVFFFTTNFHELYDPYCDDFGPVTIASVWEFCESIQGTMADSQRDNLHLVYYCLDRRDHIANAAFLLGAYLLLVLHWTPEEAAAPFQRISPNPIRPYRDATFSIQDYEITLLDCFRGLRNAVQLGWFNLRSFNFAEYKRLEDPEKGDMHIVCPKFIAFPGPVDYRALGGPQRQPPVVYAQYFAKMGVSAVIRLNEPTTYNPEPFRRFGIRHFDLFFDDCTIPSQSVISRFMEIVESEPGMVAVHCKAGLGRTGTLIALWIMKHFRLRAKDTIAWLRMVRPGMVIGPQQHFLSSCDDRQWFGNHLSGGPFEVLRPAYSAGALASQVALAMESRKLARSHTLAASDLAVV